MSDQTIDETGAPRQFGLSVPAWWPRIQPLPHDPDRAADQLDPDQAAAIGEMFNAVNLADGTKLISLMLSAEEVPRPMGVMYVNHSENAGRVLSGLLGVSASPGEIGDLHQIGKLRDTTVDLLHFDEVGSVSCVTSRRRGADVHDEHGSVLAPARDGLLRAYVIPQPQSMQAVLIMYFTTYHDEMVAPFAELCDHVTASFNWRW